MIDALHVILSVSEGSGGWAARSAIVKGVVNERMPFTGHTRYPPPTQIPRSTLGMTALTLL